MKVLFLDVDGVLNNEEMIREVHDMHYLDDTFLARIARVVKASGCKVVISSTWRLSVVSLTRLKDALARHGVEIYSLTPDSMMQPRREEILAWLNNNKQVENYAVLDDDEDADVGSGFFRTTFKDGLTDEIADQIITHFN